MTETPSEEHLGDFAYLDRYPSGEQVFTFTPKRFEELKHSSLVLLDTNVLLLPYRVQQRSLEEFLSRLRVLKENNQLRIPAHAAREFAVHRASYISKIKEMVKAPPKPSSDIDKLPVLSDKGEVTEFAEAFQKLTGSPEWDELNRIFVFNSEHHQGLALARPRYGSLPRVILRE